MIELINHRSECSKTFDLGGNKRGLDCSIGAIHYKDNYADLKEQWKDIDLTWEGNRITKAPFELTIEGNKITFKDKKTSKVSIAEITEIEGKICSKLDWVFSKGKASTLITDKTELCLEVGNGSIRLHRVYLANCLSPNIKIKQSGDLPTLCYGAKTMGEVLV